MILQWIFAKALAISRIFCNFLVYDAVNIYFYFYKHFWYLYYKIPDIHFIVVIIRNFEYEKYNNMYALSQICIYIIYLKVKLEIEEIPGNNWNTNGTTNYKVKIEINYAF